MSEKEIELEKKIFRENASFARDSVSYKLPKVSVPKINSPGDILKALQNPYKNYKRLQETSLYLINTSGIYNRIIDNFALMPNYDVVLSPNPMSMTKSSKSNQLKNYMESALLVESMNIKYNFKWMARRLLQLGELYIYKIEQKGIQYKEMPNDICRISSIENGMCKYSIDLSALSNKDLLATMPSEIQDIYKSFINKSIKPEELVDGKWHELTKNAVAFNAISNNLPKGYPPLCNLFVGLTTLEEENMNLAENSKIDNLKIITQLFEIDEDGSSKIDPSLLKMYHEATKNNLPPGIAITTSPLKTEVLNLKSQNQSINNRKEALEAVFDSGGVSSEMFNGNRSSNEAIAMSVKTDEIIALNIVRMFENYLNYELSLNKKTSHWKATIIPTTYFNGNEYKRQCETNLSFGGSRLFYLASCGMSPASAMLTLQAEQNMGIDSLLIPQANSYNSSAIGKDDKKTDNGRPTKENSDGDSNSTTSEGE